MISSTDARLMDPLDGLRALTLRPLRRHGPDPNRWRGELRAGQEPFRPRRPGTARVASPCQKPRPHARCMATKAPGRGTASGRFRSPRDVTTEAAATEPR